MLSYNARLRDLRESFLEEVQSTPLETIQDCQRWRRLITPVRPFPNEVLEKVLKREKEIAARGVAMLTKWITPIWVSGVEVHPFEIFKSVSWISFRGAFSADHSTLDIVWGEKLRALATLHRKGNEVVTYHRWPLFSSGRRLIPILTAIDDKVQSEGRRWKSLGELNVGPLTLYAEQFGLQRRRKEKLDILEGAFGNEDSDGDVSGGSPEKSWTGDAEEGE